MSVINGAGVMARAQITKKYVNQRLQRIENSSGDNLDVSNLQRKVMERYNTSIFHTYIQTHYILTYINTCTLRFYMYVNKDMDIECSSTASNMLGKIPL